MRMLWVTVIIACVLAPSAASFAQDGANLDQEKKLYQEAEAQLKAAQDRKSELANENAKLTAHIADLEKQVEAFKKQSAGEADRTFFLRSRNAAWEEFMKQYPDLMERWKYWLQNGAVKTGTLPTMGDDADWPFNAGNAE
jgi:septal ring factor EnvC (AmiA/AmiB activator)